MAILGDSFFASTHQISANLEALARSEGALANDAHYLDESNLAANSLSIPANGIASQYATATAAGEVKVLIMNGGGADILLGSCDTVDTSCPLLVSAAAAARDLLSKMAQDGVLQVVYVFYPDPVDGNVLAKIDALRPLIKSACDDSPVPCHWLDLRSTFAGHPDYIADDGLNPSTLGSRASAAAIWSTMQQYCIAQ
ncbi:MAG: SGNH/GDSL hydrolase family protein [Polyangiaceae bacterium]